MASWVTWRTPHPLPRAEDGWLLLTPATENVALKEKKIQEGNSLEEYELPGVGGVRGGMKEPTWKTGTGAAWEVHKTGGLRGASQQKLSSRLPQPLVALTAPIHPSSCDGSFISN